MRIDLDTYREILDTLTRNKSRSFLTGFGVFPTHHQAIQGLPQGPRMDHGL